MPQPTATRIVDVPLVELTIDDCPVLVPAGTTIFDAARSLNVRIPTLCHQQNENPVGVCRMCVVDIGQRVYAASCIRPVEAGMKVKTCTDEVKSVRRTLLELLLADHPSPCARQESTGDCEVERLGAEAGIVSSRFPPRPTPRGRDESSAAIAVDFEACILCDRCIRGCSEVRHNFVLARRGKGYQAGISFDDNLPMGESSCVSCGECMVSCPTGALTNRKVISTELGEGAPLSVQELRSLDVFSEVSGTFLSLNSNAVQKRFYKPGEIVCREGDYGSTAFYIVSGKADVFLSGPMGHVTTKAKSHGLLRKLKAAISPRAQNRRDEEGEEAHDRPFIPIDAPVDLPYANPIAELEAGDLFGEMTCMNQYPRSATVRAQTDCVMLEMLRNVLDVLQRNKTFRARLEQNYRKRALESQLRSIPIFSSLTPDFIEHLRDKVELRRYNAGQIICKQGEAAHSFFLVRIGFVKVSQAHPGGDLVLGYIGRGGFFGELSLLGEGIRTASCVAMDHVEAVQIRATEFQEMIERFPEIGRQLREAARQRIDENRKRVK
ncbi:MAG: cyclic nucleotide-binding domain-containing protein, partial [Terriglobales bacterium]